jgi:Cd(II)/Pb(II)-responsive transcriptional regulator
MKIGELATKAECDVQTVRYYERTGLLPAPERTHSNYRTYGPKHLKRLQFIRRCRSLDMALDEVRVLLSFLEHPEKNCASVNQLLDTHIGHVRTRLAELAELEVELNRLRRQCRKIQTADECGILRQLNAAPRTRRLSHVGKTHR